MEEPFTPINESSPDAAAEPTPRALRRPSYKTDAEREGFVLRMGKLGMSHRIIANALNIDPKTLRNHFKLILAEARLEADANVVESLYHLATSRRSPISSIFWAKTRRGYKETGFPDETEIDDTETETSQSPPTSHLPPKRPSTPKSHSTPVQPASLENVTVYNNDGEPNASE